MSKKLKQSDSDSNSAIPYKYIDADNKIYKDPYLNNNSEDYSEDIPLKKSQKSRSKKKRRTKKINKEKLTEDEIYELIEEKNEDIVELNKKTSKLKSKLATLIKKLNDKITENAEILYKKEPSESEIQWLKDQRDSKKKTLQIEQKMNHSYKVQYNILENKLKARNSLKEAKNDTKISDSEININKTQSIQSSRETNKTINVSSSLYMSLEDQINKIKNDNKDILMKINNIKNKKISQKREVDNIINGELDTQFKQKNDELIKLQNLRMDATEKYKTTDKSLEMVKKKIEYFEEKIQKHKNQNQNNETNYNEYNYYNESDNSDMQDYNHILNIIKEEINNKNKEEILEIIKNGQSNLINELKKNKKKVIKKKKILQDVSTDMNVNTPNINNKEIKNDNIDKKESKKNNKNIYKIFSILNGSNSNTNINNKTKKNENIKNENEKLSKLVEDQSVLNGLTDKEYRELINKKEEYLETNMRLEKNIKDFHKTENSKLLKVSKSIKEKAAQLKIIKEKNELIQDEINNLENIYQLSLEKEQIKAEIEKKMTIKNKENLENKKNPEKIEDKENKNEINLKKIKKEKNLDETNNNKNQLPGTREEQLKFIKKKYMEEEEGNDKNNNEENNEERITDNNEEMENEEINETNKNEVDAGDIDYKALKLEQEPFKV